MYKLAYTYQSLRTLHNYSGEIDAMLHLNELVNREFIQQAEGHTAKTGKTIRDFIKDVSAKHSMYVDLLKFDDFSTQLAKSYIVTVYQSAEQFLHEFREEHIDLFDSKWTDSDKESKIETTTRNLSLCDAEKDEILDMANLEVFNYYHKLRNCITHPHTLQKAKLNKKEKLDKKLNEKEKLDKKLNEIKDIYGQRILEMHHIDLVPNTFNEINFNDFKLFSKVVKDIAYRLCKHEQPSDNQIIRVYEKFHYSDFKSRNRNLNNNPKRWKMALESELRTLYGLDIERSTILSSYFTAH